MVRFHAAEQGHGGHGPSHRVGLTRTDLAGFEGSCLEVCPREGHLQGSNFLVSMIPILGYADMHMHFHVPLNVHMYMYICVYIYLLSNFLVDLVVNDSSFL